MRSKKIKTERNSNELTGYSIGNGNNSTIFIIMYHFSVTKKLNMQMVKFDAYI